MSTRHCQKCDEVKQGKRPAVSYRQKNTTCVVCKKRVNRVLDLHHTDADICSLECERTYWLDILY